MPESSQVGLSVVVIIIVLGLLALGILQLVGLGYISSVVFGKKSFDELSTTQQNLCKLCVVLLWITIGTGIISALGRMVGGSSSSSSNAFYF
jgi:hypothetical protein